MTYRIDGLSPEPFAPLFALSDGELAAARARRVVADSPSGYPCRVSLRDAAPGETLILVNHVSHDVPTPFRASHAIFVSQAPEPASFRDEAPDYLDRRTLGLRGFGADGMLRNAVLAMPGEADAKIRTLLEREDIAEVHAHTAALGCFLARIVRD